MAATIKDVAKLAQVSVATVSRVLNNSATVSPGKRKRIMQAIKKLNYKPNIIAQSLVNRRLNNIAIVMGHSPEQILYAPYISRMLVGFGRSLPQSGYEALIVFASDTETEIEKITSLIEAGNIQGVILLSARVYDRTINRLSEMGFPFVVIGHPHPRSIPENSAINSVDTDNVNDVREAVSYLIKMGHRRIALLHAPLGYMVNQERHDGYCYALQQAGIEVDDSLIIDAGYRVEDAVEASNRILTMQQRPTAVCATDDLKAVTFIKQASAHGLSVPGDISVVGHNNYAESQISNPSLTTVSVPLEELAVVAANVLIEVIEKPDTKAKRILLPTQLVLRDSVKDVSKLQKG